MKPDWGRKETVVWPPHVPIYTYSAIAFALFCTLFFCWERLRFQQTPLQRTYAGAFAPRRRRRDSKHQGQVRPALRGRPEEAVTSCRRT